MPELGLALTDHVDLPAGEAAAFIAQAEKFFAMHPAGFTHAMLRKGLPPSGRSFPDGRPPAPSPGREWVEARLFNVNFALNQDRERIFIGRGLSVRQGTVGQARLGSRGWQRTNW